MLALRALWAHKLARVRERGCASAGARDEHCTLLNDTSTDGATMLEWIPVVFGGMLAMLHIRRAVQQRTLSLMVCACALASAFVAGELMDAPWLVIVDAGLVVAGLALTLAVHAHVLRRRRLSARSRAATGQPLHH